MKDEKKKKVKEIVVDFDVIDIKTATEDEIIRSGIKKNTKSDKRMYLFMFIVVIFMLIPPILRIIIPKPVLFVDKEIVYADIRCFTSNNRHSETWRFDSVYLGKYRDGKLEKVELNYSYNKNVPTADDEVSFPEFTLLDDIKNDGFVPEKLDPITTEEGISIYKRKYTMNFKDYANELEKSVELKKYSYGIYTMESYFKELGFLCEIKTESKIETVSTNENK